MRRADGAAADIRYDPAARRFLGCTEDQAYLLAVEGPQPYTLFVDDAEAEPMPSSPNTWLWSAGFFAGEVPVEVVDGAGTVCLACRLDVSPAPHKVGSEEYACMLEELFAFSPHLVFGDEAAQDAIGSEGSFQDPHLAYARLKLFGPRFVAALQEVRRRPQTRLRYEREQRSLHQVRRMDGATIRAAARNPATARVLRLQSHLPEAGAPALFDIPSVEHTVDNPGNRTLLAVVRAVLRRVRSVRGAFEHMLLAPSRGGEGDELRSRLARRLRFVVDLEVSLRAILGAAPFDETSRAEISAAGLNTVAAHPVYARAYRHGWHALRPGIAGERGDERLWMSPTWQVYERWAFVQLVQALRRLLGNAEGAITYPSRREDFVKFSCVAGLAKVQAYLQPRFPAGDQPAPHGFRSISGERYPDLVLTIEGAGERRFIVFDAKYRVSRHGVLEGMESAHLYRDSLRWNGQAPDVAVILVPAGGGAPWLEEPGFRQREGVGVVALSPGGLSGGLEEFLRSAVAAAGAT